MTTPMLEIRNLHARIDDREILKGVNLTVPAGQVHAIMGRNGSGKSTLSYVLAGKEDYEVTEGEVLLDGKDLLGLEPSGYFENDKLTALIEQTPAKAQHVALAIVLGACESITGKQTWRYPSSTDADYLTLLASWGYSLSDVEQIVTTEKAADADGNAPAVSAEPGDGD